MKKGLYVRKTEIILNDIKTRKNENQSFTIILQIKAYRMIGLINILYMFYNEIL